ncbi:uncharacterized protein LOC126841134 isoform X2 [Adelges cooleyi]|uniref:uncharacterized protein LOC126841134 isoform X2 n=1 Tax=Adelges cooleyi TaxID=133065 RepID=UPI00217F3738|nr:uncharacterized protein LOC126841134 isoform X2 [Adelges cooleyi]
MTEKDLNKFQFLRLLSLQAITPSPPNDTLKICFASTNPFVDLSDKNNSIKTGYEDFQITKGSLKLYPVRDFDFIGKHVVCQKCCQKFASKLSYRAHVNTDICTRTYNGPNLIYLNYKFKHGRQRRKKNSKSRFLEELNGHHLKKNLLNPEMLNTLQTRNNCYSDIVPTRVKGKHKITTTTNTTPTTTMNTSEPPMKKPRGRPRKIVEEKLVRKRGRPKKIIQTENSNSSNVNVNTTSMKTEVSTADDAYNNNINMSKKQLSNKFKIVANKFWSLVGKELRIDNDIGGHQWIDGYLNVSQCDKKEKVYVSPPKEKNLLASIDQLENEINQLIKQVKNVDEPGLKGKLDLMLKKINESRNNKKEVAEISNGLVMNKGKENIHHKHRVKEEMTETNRNLELWKNEKTSGIETITLSDEPELFDQTNGKNDSNNYSPDVTVKQETVTSNHVVVNSVCINC